MLYRLYCEICNYNRVTDGTDLDDLVKYSRSPVQNQIPKWNEKEKKTDPGKFQKLPKQFKCPKCGRLIKLFKLREDDKKDNNSRN